MLVDLRNVLFNVISTGHRLMYISRASTANSTHIGALSNSD